MLPPPVVLGTLFSEQGGRRSPVPTGQVAVATQSFIVAPGVSTTSELWLGSVPFEATRGPGGAWMQQQREQPSKSDRGVLGGCLPGGGKPAEPVSFWQSPCAHLNAFFEG